jgi:hypothetical protein|tara:strand:+ start:2392 stop:2643 length:252 start_codon:yes stop_codon:yes gene_type:complete
MFSCGFYFFFFFSGIGTTGGGYIFDVTPPESSSKPYITWIPKYKHINLVSTSKNKSIPPLYLSSIINGLPEKLLYTYLIKTGN